MYVCELKLLHKRSAKSFISEARASGFQLHMLKKLSGRFYTLEMSANMVIVYYFH